MVISLSKSPRGGHNAILPQLWKHHRRRRHFLPKLRFRDRDLPNNSRPPTPPPKPKIGPLRWILIAAGITFVGGVVLLAGFIVLLVRVSQPSSNTTSSPSIVYFDNQLEAGAGCRELFAIRNLFDPKSRHIERMNEDLIAIGCHTSESIRDRPGLRKASPIQTAPAPTPSPDQTFTVREYRIYRMVLDTPLSVTDQEAFRKAGAKHQATPEEVREIFDRVELILSRNGWFGPARIEINRASDWNGEEY